MKIFLRLICYSWRYWDRKKCLEITAFWGESASLIQKILWRTLSRTFNIYIEWVSEFILHRNLLMVFNFIFVPQKQEQKLCKNLVIADILFWDFHHKTTRHHWTPLCGWSIRTHSKVVCWVCSENIVFHTFLP